jgi:TatD DNase family protein
VNDVTRGIMLDTHCHIDEYPDPLAEVRALDGTAVAAVAVTSTPRAFEALRRRFDKEHRVRIALGVHPLRASTLNEADWRIFERRATEARYIGEVGLDFSAEGRATRAAQERAFRRVLRNTAGRRQLLTVHSRGAERPVLDLLTELGAGPAVFHWYSGPFKVLDGLLEAGHYCSFNPAMVRSKKGQEIIRRVPRDRALTETDGPFVKVGERRARPGDVRVVYERLSALWQEPIGTVIEIVYRNFTSVLSDSEEDSMLGEPARRSR